MTRSDRIRPPRVVIPTVVVCAALMGAPGTAAAQFRMDHPPEDLREYGWTAWLAGSWEGHRIWPNGERLPFRQSFEFAVDNRYLLVRAWAGEEPDGYGGIGLFSYYPATGDCYGEWFGVNHDWNYGWCVRDGDRTVWTIRRLGMTITRTRTRTGDDEYMVTSSTLHPDGSITESREEMRRIR